MASKFEYVASGTGYLKIYNNPLKESPEALEEVKNVFRLMNRDDHKFSMLFNAFVEPKYGEDLTNYYKDSFHTIHSDSGGLQVITQGSEITEKVKEQIYGVQGKYSDIAMSFDEIPIIVNEKSVIGDTKNRIFDTANMEDKARQTGRNVKKQIEYFLEMKTSTKPLLVLQGNCFETFMRWFDCAISEIPSNLHQYIGGISIAGSSHGNGLLEDIERAFVAGQLSSHFNNYYHLLGVGSFRKLLPYMVLLKNGYLKDIHVSYDSTSHTSAVARVDYIKDDKKTSLGKHFNQKYSECFNEMVDFNPRMSKLDAKTFYKIINSNNQYFRDESKIILDKEKVVDYYLTRLSFFGLSVHNFTKHVDEVTESKKKI